MILSDFFFALNYNTDPISRGLKPTAVIEIEIVLAYYNTDPISRGLKLTFVNAFLVIIDYNTDPISRGLKRFFHSV